MSTPLIYKNAVDVYSKKLEKLEQQLKEAEKVINFYAKCGDVFEDYDLTDDFSTVTIAPSFTAEIVGKRAREYKEKYKAGE